MSRNSLSNPLVAQHTPLMTVSIQGGVRLVVGLALGLRLAAQAGEMTGENQPAAQSGNAAGVMGSFPALSRVQPLARESAPKPLLRAHAHNDYLHPRPLLDALDHGFCSVEADLHLMDGRLFVAHSREGVKPGRTLEALYLEPLRYRVRQNGGRVYAGGPEFTLLVDLKGDWRISYPVLRRVLETYSEMLSSYRAGFKQTNAISVIVTGDRSREMFAGESVRYAALDGAIADLDGDAPADLTPWISSSWGSTFTWRGTGPLPDAEQLKLKNIVIRAHQQGRRVRFWGAPDRLVFWREMLANGVDLINTDDLDGVRRFLLEERH
jgi:hypothetical protein